MKKAPAMSRGFSFGPSSLQDPLARRSADAARLAGAGGELDEGGAVRPLARRGRQRRALGARLANSLRPPRAPPGRFSLDDDG